MQSRWSEAEAQEFVTRYAPKGVNADLAVRTYTTRLLGSDPRPGLINVPNREDLRDKLHPCSGDFHRTYHPIPILVFPKPFGERRQH